MWLIKHDGLFFSKKRTLRWIMICGILYKKLLIKLKRGLFRYFRKGRKLKYQFISTAKILGSKPCINQPVLFLGIGKISIGSDVSFGIDSSPGFLSQYGYLEVRHSDSQIRIGDHVAINNNCCIISNGSLISIANYCAIGANVTIIDSDFHSLEPELRKKKIPGKNRAISVGTNVFIGNNVTILKGVSIGGNSVIAAGSVVVKSIPSNVIAGGNPCRIIRYVRSNND